MVKDLGENDLYYSVPPFRHFRRIDTGEEKMKAPPPHIFFFLERGVYRAKMAERRNKTTYSHSPQRVNCVPRAVAPRSMLDLAGTKASPKRRKVLELELQFPLEHKSSSG